MSLDVSKIQATPKGKEVLVVTATELQPYFAYSLGKQEVYKCPLCPDRGHKGRGYKLYLDPHKGQGYCFVCQLIYVFNECYDLGVETTKWKQRFKEKEEAEKRFEVISWTRDVAALPPEHECTNYFTTKRCMVHPPVLLQQHNIRYTEAYAGYPGTLIFPNDVDQTGITNFFQYKVIDERYQLPKYLQICAPPLMWLDLHAKLSNKIILVEGVFDALATFGVAMLGKALSEKQQKELREYCLSHQSLEKIIVAPDGEVENELSEKLCQAIKSLSNGVPVYFARLPEGKDPENVVAEGRFREIFEEKLEEVA